MGSLTALYYAAAAATAIAGMLHLMLGPNNLGFNVNQGILFIVGGIAQVFWIIPMIRRWGKVLYGIGIAGTAVFMALFFITRVPGNPITGRGGGANPTSIAVEVFQGIFIALAIAIIIYESRRQARAEKSSNGGRDEKHRKHVPVLAGIAVALILIGVFALPMVMPRPMGGPPGQGGGPPGPAALSQNPNSPIEPARASMNQTCTLTPSLIEVEETPQQTEGPYFVDGMPNRSDIRSDTSSGVVQAGIPLNLAINVFDLDDGVCSPLSGAQVDIWHADSKGVYSGVQEEGTAGTNYLRGYQLTNDNGTAQFSSVYPGWYEGRAIHIHIKVRTFEGSTETFEWISQFYIDDSTNQAVHLQAPYSEHGTPSTTNANDDIFAGPSTDGLIQSNTGEHLMLALTDTGLGYQGSFNVVVDAPDR
jgi:protocatechuate 3,4-dioxygenase beta subunit